MQTLVEWTIPQDAPTYYLKLNTQATTRIRLFACSIDWGDLKLQAPLISANIGIFTHENTQNRHSARRRLRLLLPQNTRPRPKKTSSSTKRRARLTFLSVTAAESTHCKPRSTDEQQDQILNPARFNFDDNERENLNDGFTPVFTKTETTRRRKEGRFSPLRVCSKFMLP